MRRCVPLALALLSIPPLAAEKLTDQQRVELIRGLTAEYATVKAPLPRSRKALEYDSAGKYDRTAWDAAGKELGPAARVGDLVQVTKVDIESDKIVLAINGGFNSGKPRWRDRIQVGIGSQTAPISRGQSNAPGGTSIALLFRGPVPPMKADAIKKMLAPVLDFEKRTVTETFMESLPPEFQQAVKEKRAMVGMDHDQVLLALGKPVRKVREVIDGVETEDWIYGMPPGKIVFVTFNGSKVVKVKEDYAGLGTQAAPLESPR
jgi:hypothetical protein